MERPTRRSGLSGNEEQRTRCSPRIAASADQRHQSDSGLVVTSPAATLVSCDRVLSRASVAALCALLNDGASWLGSPAAGR